jgi:hypothetical protein
MLRGTVRTKVNTSQDNSPYREKTIERRAAARKLLHPGLTTIPDGLDIRRQAAVLMPWSTRMDRGTSLDSFTSRASDIFGRHGCRA